MSYRIFISHRYADRDIAACLRSHLQAWGIPAENIATSASRVGTWALSESVRHALWNANLFFLIYTVPDEDWGYCMWEAGVASDPGSPDASVVVLQCGQDRPNLLPDSIQVELTLESVTTFATAFFKKGLVSKEPPFNPEITTGDLARNSRRLLNDLRIKAGAEERELSRWAYFQQLLQSHSVFGSPEPQESPFDVFVLMPFEPSLRPVFEDHIKKVVAPLGRTIGRADDFFSVGSVVHEIWAGICHAQVIIADCTGRNPNVFYEIGIAHTLDKSTILIAQSKDDIPFDVRHLRWITYEYTPRGMAAFEQALTRTLTNLFTRIDA